MTIALAIIAGVIAALSIAAAVVQTDRLRDMRDDLRTERRIRAELEYSYRTAAPDPQAVGAATDTTDCLHVWGKWGTPTDTTHGRIQERACSICGETRQRNIGHSLTAPVAEPQPIPATPHPVSSTEIADKYEDHAWTQALDTARYFHRSPGEEYERIIREYPGDPAEIHAAVHRRTQPRYTPHRLSESRYK